MSRRILVVAAVLALSIVVSDRAGGDDLASIGKRVKAGDLVAARDDYLRLLETQPSTALYYNLGHVDQKLGGGPQAILWYRRALDRAPGDPWARENLQQLRADLGVPPPDPWQPIAVLRTLTPIVAWMVVAGLWGLLGWRWLTGRPRGRALIISASALIGVHLGVQAVARLAPAEAVLMSDCHAGETSLPAGSEVWLSRSIPTRVWTTGGRFECDAETILSIDSERLPPLPITDSAAPTPPASNQPVGLGDNSEPMA